MGRHIKLDTPIVTWVNWYWKSSCQLHWVFYHTIITQFAWSWGRYWQWFPLRATHTSSLLTNSPLTYSLPTFMLSLSSLVTNQKTPFFICTLSLETAGWQKTILFHLLNGKKQTASTKQATFMVEERSYCIKVWKQVVVTKENCLTGSCCIWYIHAYHRYINILRYKHVYINIYCCIVQVCNAFNKDCVFICLSLNAPNMNHRTAWLFVNRINNAIYMCQVCVWLRSMFFLTSVTC